MSPNLEPTTRPVDVAGPGVPAAEVSAAQSRTASRIGWVITALIALFLLFDAVIHVLKIQQVVDSFADLGFPIGTAVTIGVLELLGLGLFLVPRTSMLGALLLTAYLGGAVSAQVRIEAPLWSTTLFPVYVAVLLWAGFWLRDGQVRAVIPLRAPA